MKRVLVALAGVAAGAGAVVVVLTSGGESSPGAAAALTLVIGWAYIGSGLVAWRQRPENRLGPVMIFIGFSWFLAALVDADQSLVFSAGKAAEDLPLLGFVYLVLAFPSGRLRTGLDRALVAAAAVLTTLVELV